MSTQRGLVAFVAAAVAMVALPMFRAEAGPSPRAGDRADLRMYAGGLTGPRDRVRLRVRFDAGTPVAGSFRASNVALLCEDGEFRRFSFKPMELRFDGSEFEAESYRSTRPRNLERYSRVAGDLRARARKAGGYFYAFHDPAGEDTPELACTTGTLLARWATS